MSFKRKVISNFLGLRIQRKLYHNSIAKLQKKRWNKLRTTLLSSPYYRELAEKNAPLSEYPVINKSIFMEQFDSINTRAIQREMAYEVALKAETTRDFAPTINGVTIGLSSGTSGNRGIFMASEDERAQWVGCVLDRVIGFSPKRRSVAFFLRANSNLYDSVKSRVLRFEFFDLLQPLSSQMSRLNELQPSILVAQPSLLLELADQVDNGKINIAPDKVISVAEVLYPEDKKRLEATFKQIVHQVYQCTEGLLATTCSHGTLHFNEDFLIIEKKYLDAEETRFHPVITDLVRTSQPVIRYELNDIIVEKTDCKCGSTMTGIAQIEGRSDDVLQFHSATGEKVALYPDFFRRAIIMSNKTIEDYTLVQTSAHELELYLNNTVEVFEMAKKRIDDFLHQNNINDINIRRVHERHHEKGNKLRRIRNDYGKAN